MHLAAPCRWVPLTFTLGRTMDVVVFGSLNDAGLEVVERDGKLFVRYDAGAHVIAWREDEITREDLRRIQSGPDGEYWTIIELQKRLEARGEDPYRQNWLPSAHRE
jgi:hypothetical protein